MKTFKHLLALSSLFCLVGCNQNEEKFVYEEAADVVVTHEYSEVSDYELVWDSMFDVELNSYYVYFYSTTCDHCANLKNYIIEKALERHDIYFVKASNKDQIGEASDIQKNAENPVDIWILGYPSLIKIVDKKCIKNLAGINQIKAELK